MEEEAWVREEIAGRSVRPPSRASRGTGAVSRAPGEAVPPDGSILVLYRHDRDQVLRVDGHEPMSTRRHGSAETLAGPVCAAVREHAGGAC